MKIEISEYKISIWERHGELKVVFTRAVKFVPAKIEEHEWEYNFEVEFPEQSVFPFDFFGADNFYSPTDEERRVMDAIISEMGLPMEGFENRIDEDDSFYVVSLDNDQAFGRYYFDKNTCKEIFEMSMEGSYAPLPFDEEFGENEDSWRQIFCDDQKG